MCGVLALKLHLGRRKEEILTVVQLQLGAADARIGFVVGDIFRVRADLAQEQRQIGNAEILAQAAEQHLHILLVIFFRHAERTVGLALVPDHELYAACVSCARDGAAVKRGGIKVVVLIQEHPILRFAVIRIGRMQTGAGIGCRDHADRKLKLVDQRIDHRRDDRRTRAVIGVLQMLPLPPAAVCRKIFCLGIRRRTLTDHVGLPDAENVDADAPARFASCLGDDIVFGAACTEVDAVPSALRNILQRSGPLAAGVFRNGRPVHDGLRVIQRVECHHARLDLRRLCHIQLARKCNIRALRFGVSLNDLIVRRRRK